MEYKHKIEQAISNYKAKQKEKEVNRENRVKEKEM
jgi:hypothetical protein